MKVELFNFLKEIILEEPDTNNYIINNLKELIKQKEELIKVNNYNYIEICSDVFKEYFIDYLNIKFNETREFITYDRNPYFYDKFYCTYVSKIKDKFLFYKTDSEKRILENIDSIKEVFKETVKIKTYVDNEGFCVNDTIEILE